MSKFLTIDYENLEDFIDELADNIEEHVLPSMALSAVDLDGDLLFGDEQLPYDDLKDAIREVLERWIEEKSDLT